MIYWLSQTINYASTQTTIVIFIVEPNIEMADCEDNG